MARPTGKHNVADGLTERQLKWCLAFASNGGNNTAACKSVGIHFNTGRGYQQNPKVQEYLQTLAKINQEDIVSTEEIAVFLSKFITGEVTDQLVNIKSGKIENLQANSLSRLKAAEILLKMRGELMNVHKVEQETTIVVDLVDDDDMLEGSFNGDFLEVNDTYDWDSDVLEEE